MSIFCHEVLLVFLFLCPEDVFSKDRPFYEFENIEKNDHSLILGDLSYKTFYIFNKYKKLAEGRVEGLAEGLEKGRLEIAKKMLLGHFTME